MNEITIWVRDNSLRHTDGYSAVTSHNPEQSYDGVSPDEALGYAIRELDLSGAFDGLVKLTLIREFDPVYPDGCEITNEGEDEHGGQDSSG